MLRMKENEFNKFLKAHSDITIRRELPDIGDKLIAALKDVEIAKKKCKAAEARMNKLFARMFAVERIILALPCIQQREVISGKEGEQSEDLRGDVEGRKESK